MNGLNPYVKKDQGLVDFSLFAYFCHCPTSKDHLVFTISAGSAVFLFQHQMGVGWKLLMKKERKAGLVKHCRTFRGRGHCSRLTALHSCWRTTCSEMVCFCVLSLLNSLQHLFFTSIKAIYTYTFLICSSCEFVVTTSNNVVCAMWTYPLGDIRQQETVEKWFSFYKYKPWGSKNCTIAQARSSGDAKVLIMVLAGILSLHVHWVSHTTPRQGKIPFLVPAKT